MELIQTQAVDFNFQDERGTLTQLIHDGYKQVNVITSKKGVFRGGHYHKDNSEAFYIVEGNIKLEAHIINSDIIETYFFQTGDFFVIPPFVLHSFEFCQDTILVSMYSKGVEKNDGSKDIYTMEE